MEVSSNPTPTPPPPPPSTTPSRILTTSNSFDSKSNMAGFAAGFYMSAEATRLFNTLQQSPLPLVSDVITHCWNWMFNVQKHFIFLILILSFSPRFASYLYICCVASDLDMRVASVNKMFSHFGDDGFLHKLIRSRHAIVSFLLHLFEKK